ncbi:hypothetical protein ACFVFI_18615 [Streptomyces sp. NPDC057705]|uniref:hypothetical protein n=1 Tax=Streptomyces sp. NPDC057705 TaxID=3346222 RepID=UPI0036C4D1DD
MERRWIGIAAFLGAITLSACGAGGGTESAQPGGEPAVSENPTEVDPARITLPLDHYRQSAEDQKILNQAFSAEMTHCMARYGFSYPATQSSSVDEIGNSRRYGIHDAEAARERGYHPPKDLLDKQRALDAGQNQNKLSNEAQAVASGKGQSELNGKEIPVGGCQGEVARNLLRGIKNIPKASLVDELSAQSYDRSLQHSRVREAFGQWSTCMKESGFNYRSPMDANNDRAFSAEEPTQIEMDTATADIGCRKKTRLIAVWASVDSAYQKKAIEGNAIQLAQIREAQVTQVKNAASSIGQR